MELNLHGYLLEDAKLEILNTIEDCNELGDNILKIIHGHKHGTAIRDYVRSNRFLNDISKLKCEITSKDFSDEGVSVFHLNLSRATTEKSKILSKAVIPEHKSETKKSLNMCHKCNKSMTLVKGINWYKCPKCGKLKKGFL